MNRRTAIIIEAQPDLLCGKGEFEVILDGDRVANIRGRHISEISVKPGEHIIVVKSGSINTGKLKLRLDQGQTRRVQFRATNSCLLPLVVIALLLKPAADKYLLGQFNPDDVGTLILVSLIIICFIVFLVRTFFVSGAYYILRKIEQPGATNAGLVTGS